MQNNENTISIKLPVSYRKNLVTGEVKIEYADFDALDVAQKLRLAATKVADLKC